MRIYNYSILFFVLIPIINVCGFAQEDDPKWRTNCYPYESYLPDVHTAEDSLKEFMKYRRSNCAADWETFRRDLVFGSSVSSRVKKKIDIPERADELYIEGMRLRDLKEYQKAIYKFVAAIKLAPWYGNPYMELGLCAKVEEDYLTAIPALEGYIFTKPGIEQIWRAKETIAEIRALQGKQASDRHKFAGNWICEGNCGSVSSFRVKVNLYDNTIVITQFGYQASQPWDAVVTRTPEYFKQKLTFEVKVYKKDTKEAIAEYLFELTTIDFIKLACRLEEKTSGKVTRGTFIKE